MWNENPFYVGGMLCLLIVASVWLARYKGFKLAGSPILVILLCAIVSNIGLLPSGASDQPIYNGVFTYLTPLSIFILQLEVNLKSLRKAGTPMLLLFLAGALATMAGIIISYAVIHPEKSIGQLAPAIAGMYTGTYIGGSINFNAVALEYGVMQDGELFAATTVVDNMVGTPWIIVALLLPRWLQKIRPSKRTGISNIDNTLHKMGEQQISVTSLGIMTGIGLMVIFISNTIQQFFPKIPSVLILTTIALVLAQFPFVKKIKGLHTIGLFLTLIFLGVIGTLCDVGMLMESGEKAGILLAFAGLAVLLHGIFLFGITAILKADWDLAGMASLTNIGGTTTAIAGSEGLNRPDLLLPGILVGSLGNALGTYAGFAVAGWLGA
ncbi:MAG: DUF819 family protein [Chitinophagaceae bacterium]|nr:DUF819 family protein [Chitinophagaceae bacterium]